MGVLRTGRFVAFLVGAALTYAPLAVLAQGVALVEAGCSDGAGGLWRPRGQQTLTLGTAFGVGLPIGPARGSDLEEVRYTAVLPRWSVGITDCVGRDSWYRGALSLGVEGLLMFNHEPHSGFAGGITPLLHYEFQRRGRLIPYVEAGVGPVFTDLDLDKQADGLNFASQAGLGVRYVLSERSELIFGWRFHHISNAGLDDPNTGLDSSMFLLGVNYHFDR